MLTCNQAIQVQHEKVHYQHPSSFSAVRGGDSRGTPRILGRNSYPPAAQRVHAGVYTCTRVLVVLEYPVLEYYYSSTRYLSSPTRNPGSRKPGYVHRP
eukprot:2782439-Rhodomonas_salina.2